MGDENDVYRRQGFGQLVGLGRAPALVIVDFVRAFADPAQFGGGNIADAIAATVPLLGLARERAWPALDVSAGAVLLASLTASVIGLLVFLSRLAACLGW